MANHCWLWDRNVIIDVLMTCIILCNMVIKDEEDLVLESIVESPNNIQMRRGLTFVKYVEGTNEIEK